MSFPTTTGVDTSGNTGGFSNSPNPGIFIVYGVAGIVAVVFLGFIITGAVRAHRHPERYGPHRIAGEQGQSRRDGIAPVRQSKARGIAQAMLDTIPVIKFNNKNNDNDDNGADAAERDVEMMAADNPACECSPPLPEGIAETGQTNTQHESELLTTEQPSEQPNAMAATPELKIDAALDGGNFSCPICTDDFIKAQELRVLPCNHQFHAKCIDPWLLNFSSTCPLCRIDLNPPKADENDEQEGENTEHHTEETAAVEDSATPIADGTQSHHYHHRLTNYLHNPLNVRRILDATVEERLATLRHIRQAIPGEGARDEDTATRAGRNPLSMRLFERFRIRTRAHGIEASSPAVNSISTLTVPPPAHLAGSSTLESIT